MKKYAQKMQGWLQSEPIGLGRFIERLAFLLLIVSLIIGLSSCSRGVSITPIPSLPANLKAHCTVVRSAPAPFFDPERIIWEMEIIAQYADCAARHRMIVDAWPGNT